MSSQRNSTKKIPVTESDPDNCNNTTEQKISATTDSVPLHLSHESISKNSHMSHSESESIIDQKFEQNKESDSDLVKSLIESAYQVRYGISNGDSISYNIAICSTGKLREEAVKNYLKKCGVKNYLLKDPDMVKSAAANEFPELGKFTWAKNKSKSLFSNKLKYVPDEEDKKWIARKIIQENEKNNSHSSVTECIVEKEIVGS